MTWKIDQSHTQIEFSVRHMMISKVRGRFETFKADIDLNTEDLTASRIEGVIDVTSINTANEQRDEHLRSADFFNVQEYPQMTFRSTNIEAVGNGQYKVYGDLTIKDVTKPIVFDVTDEGEAKDPWGSTHRGFSARAKLNRKDFDLNWNVALETGGWLVGDEVTISAEVELVEEQQSELEPAAA